MGFGRSCGVVDVLEMIMGGSARYQLSSFLFLGTGVRIAGKREFEVLRVDDFFG